MMNNVKSREQECALKQLMAYDFLQLELHLFLDTHPHDQRALKEFRSANEKAKALREKYEKTYGPITASAVDSDASWTWIETPWPWEN